MAEQISNPKESSDNVLPAPSGWKKKLVPKNSGTPKKNDVVFVSPTGEEFKAKRPLERYLKANPGGPSMTDFDWSTGEITPTRRSARIIEKVKDSPVKTPESESKKKPKRTRKSQGDSEDAEKQEAQAETGKEEEMQDAHQGEDTVKAEAGEDDVEKKEVEEAKDDEAKPEKIQEEKEDQPKTAELNEIPEKAEKKSVDEPQIHPDEAAVREPPAVEDEEKPKSLDNKNENGFEGTGPVQNYDCEKRPEPVKEADEQSQKIRIGEEIQKAQEILFL